MDEAPSAGTHVHYGRRRSLSAYNLRSVIPAAVKSVSVAAGRNAGPTEELPVDLGREVFRYEVLVKRQDFRKVRALAAF